MVVTAVAAVVMIDFKNWVNRSEAMRAMAELGREVLRYRQQYGSVPPESYVDSIKEDLAGHVRLTNLQYRARWIDFESDPNEILAYTEKRHHSLLFGYVFIVLRLNGSVELMDKHEFEKLLAQQQSPAEIEEKRWMMERDERRRRTGDERQGIDGN